MIKRNNTERLNDGDRLALEVEASLNTRRCWICVAPFKLSSEEWMRLMDEPPNEDPRSMLKLEESLPWRFQIQIFEVDQSFDYEKFDLHPEYIHTRHDSIAESVDELKETLAEFGVDIDQLCDPSECNYPL